MSEEAGSTLARYEGRDRKLVAARTAILVVDAQNAELVPEIGRASCRERV